MFEDFKNLRTSNSILMYQIVFSVYNIIFFNLDESSGNQEQWIEGVKSYYLQNCESKKSDFILVKAFDFFELMLPYLRPNQHIDTLLFSRMVLIFENYTLRFHQRSSFHLHCRILRNNLGR